MVQNEGKLDRVARAIFGGVIFYFAYVSFEGALAIVGYVVGVILIITAVTGHCCLYKLLGISTKK
jgi:hypothetical protein